MKILIIDDRKDQRESIRRFVESEIPKKWSVIDMPPFEDLEDYVSFISENEISVILVDERLQEQSNNNIVVSYNGHDFISFIRSKLYTFPIYVVTAYDGDSDLIEKFSDVEGIINKTDFTNDILLYLPRIIRSGQHFVETFQVELDELSNISKKIVKGEVTADELQRARAIQTKLNIAFTTEKLNEKQILLQRLKGKLDEFDILKARIDKFIEKKK